MCLCILEKPRVDNSSAGSKWLKASPCVGGVSILPLSKVFLLDFGLTVVFFVFLLVFRTGLTVVEKQKIPLSHQF
jgi:hypothetical protein